MCTIDAPPRSHEASVESSSYWQVGPLWALLGPELAVLLTSCALLNKHAHIYPAEQLLFGCASAGKKPAWPLAWPVVSQYWRELSAEYTA